MKLITAIIKPYKLDEVREALSEVGVTGLTITDVKGFGRQKGHTELYRGAEYEVRLLPKVKVEVACATGDIDRLVEAIISAAKEADRDDADALFISCTAIRAVDVVDEIERMLNKPVVCANQALFWEAVRTAGYAAPMEGYGRLLTMDLL